MKLRFLVPLVLLAVPGALGQSPASIGGDYVEVRSNHVYTCGCLYSGELVTDGREAILAWNFLHGSFEGLPLEEVTVVAVIVGGENLSAEDANRRTAIYLNESGWKKRRAIVRLLQEQYGRTLGKIVHTRSAFIAFEKKDGVVTVRVPRVAHLAVREARLPEDAHLGSSRWYGPFIPVTDPMLATVLLYEYEGKDFARRWKRLDPAIAGYTGEFAIAL